MSEIKKESTTKSEMKKTINNKINLLETSLINSCKKNKEKILIKQTENKRKN